MGITQTSLHDNGTYVFYPKDGVGCSVLENGNRAFNAMEGKLLLPAREPCM